MERLKYGRKATLYKGGYEIWIYILPSEIEKNYNSFANDGSIGSPDDRDNDGYDNNVPVTRLIVTPEVQSEIDRRKNLGQSDDYITQSLLSEIENRRLTFNYNEKRKQEAVDKNLITHPTYQSYQPISRTNIQSANTNNPKYRYLGGGKYMSEKEAKAKGLGPLSKFDYNVDYATRQFNNVASQAHKMHTLAVNGSGLNKVRMITDSLRQGVKTDLDNANNIANSAKVKGQDTYNKKVTEWKDIKRGMDAAMTAAELLSAGQVVGSKILPNFTTQGNTFFGQKVNSFINALTSNNAHLTANIVGSIADGYQFLTANNRYDKIENGVELGADVAGIVGGLDVVKNSPLFGRYGNAIDKTLDVTGLSAASWDIIKQIPPLSNLLDMVKTNTNK